MSLSLLKEAEENKLNHIISSFSKTESGVLKFS